MDFKLSIGQKENDMYALKLWNCRVPHHVVTEGPPRRWSTDSSGNTETTVWACSKREAKTVASRYLPGNPHEVVVRRTRLVWNEDLCQAPDRAREFIAKIDYRGTRI